jgi:hypothetical protein
MQLRIILAQKIMVHVILKECRSCILRRLTVKSASECERLFILLSVLSQWETVFLRQEKCTHL